jgi:hypothetical protein
LRLIPKDHRRRDRETFPLCLLWLTFHRNESAIVVRLYDLLAWSYLDTLPSLPSSLSLPSISSLPSLHDEQGQQQQAACFRVFWERARIPVYNDLNSTIEQEYYDISHQRQHQHQRQLQASSSSPSLSSSFLVHEKGYAHSLERARKYASKYYSFLQNEDDIHVATAQEGILNSGDIIVIPTNNNHSVVWDVLLKPPTMTTPTTPTTCWNGYGGMATAQAFINYAQVCSRYRLPEQEEVNNNNNDDNNKNHNSNHNQWMATRHSNECTRYKEIIKKNDQPSKIFLLVHPNVFTTYIQAVLTSFPYSSSPYHVLSKLRQVRYLYQKSFSSVGRPKKDRIVHQQEEYNGQQQQQDLDYETSLRGLCRDYLNFEWYFGSEHSYTNASKAVQRKLAKAYTEQQDHYHQYHVEPTINITTITTNTKATQPESFHRKRKVEDDQVDHDVDMEDGGDALNEPTSKKPKKDTRVA